MRLEISPASPLDSFRVACPQCLQRSYVPKLGLLGLRKFLFFGAQAIMVELWGWLRTRKFYVSVRYNPALEAYWSQYKEGRAKEHLQDDDVQALHELSFLRSVKFRLGFMLHLARALISGKLALFS